MPESTCVYVYTNLGYKGMTLTNNCSYFVYFSFSLIHTHIRGLQRNMDGGSTYISFNYFKELMNMIMEEYQDLQLTS